MKIFKNKPYLLLFLFGLSLIFLRCGDIESIHEQYLNGETIYAGRLDTLTIRPGYYRAQLEGYTQFLGNSNQIIIEFNGTTQTLDINNDEEIYAAILSELGEESYEFNVTTKDPDGNLSIPQTVAGFAVGDEFVSDQDPRQITDFSFNADGNFVNFSPNAESEYVIFTTIDYENEANEIVRDTAFFEDNRLKLNDFKPLGNISSKSYLQSGVNGIDTIPLPANDYILPNVPYSELDKSYFQLVQMSSDNLGTNNNANPELYLFDGDGSWSGDDTFSYFSNPGDMPHHFTIDLGVMTTLRKVKLEMPDPNSSAQNNATEVQIWGRDGLEFAETSANTNAAFYNAGWSLLYEGTVDGAAMANNSFLVSPANQVRYIRYRVLSTVGNTNSQLTEMTLYGQDSEAIVLDKSLFSMSLMPSDNPGISYGGNPSNYLWDNNGIWSGNDAYGYHSGENAVPGHFTIDLGVTTQLSKCKIHFRDPNNFSGNNPTQLEIWGRPTLEGGETLPVFQSIGNSVLSDPVTSESFENAGWQLIVNQSISGGDLQSIEFDFPPGPLSKYIRFRYTSTVGNQAFQLIEMELSGYGAITN
ncbi:DUF4998 domain-containing protein [Flavobacteriaceae bacterium]|nr:DUF4998 domain-containing protein [Flavobacteriaceae bacterium]